MEQIPSERFEFNLSELSLEVFDKHTQHLYPPILLPSALRCALVHPTKPWLFTLCLGDIGINVWHLETAAHLFTIEGMESPAEFIMSNSGRFIVIRSHWDAISSAGDCFYLIDLQGNINKHYTLVELVVEYPYEFDPKVYFSDTEHYLYLIWDDEFEDINDVFSMRFEIHNDEGLQLVKGEQTHQRVPQQPYHPDYYPFDLTDNLSELAILKYGQHFDG
ncbi:hypothetical protein [Pseudoalteromonas sp. MMG022]|uniref:hypothetical protein n=1 Tax=Pseudoalteromonas sp. MMG022 TaxID=2909978 RepID=UPI001F35A203|nr:hypothetical protein [Pseudoalteromonas sp. MMG022]MCF6436639.1 hypothetical protein [Pseudoalteromonas sp. MMG022]